MFPLKYTYETVPSQVSGNCHYEVISRQATCYLSPEYSVGIYLIFGVALSLSVRAYLPSFFSFVRKIRGTSDD